MVGPLIPQIETAENGFSVVGGPPVLFADAGRLLQAIRAADTLDSANEIDHEGEGLAGVPRNKFGKGTVQRKLGLNHISNVAKLLGHASKHNAGVAAEDAGHAAAAADVYSPRTAHSGGI